MNAPCRRELVALRNMLKEKVLKLETFNELVQRLHVDDFR